MKVRQLQEQLLDLQRRGFGDSVVTIDGKGRVIRSVEATASKGVSLKTEK